jgi:hypothetical protein
MGLLLDIASDASSPAGTKDGSPWYKRCKRSTTCATFSAAALFGMRATLHTWLGIIWRAGGLADLGQLRGQVVVQPHLLVQYRDQQVRPVDLPKGVDKGQHV